jgi:predicted nucleotidyltransferase
MKQDYKYDTVIQTFKKVIDSIDVPYLFIYIFGSRAKGMSNENSDYDFFIAIPDSYNQKMIKRIISKEIHKQIPCVAFDILVRNISDFEDNKEQINSIYNTIYTEGIIL